ncbi:MAG: hypothetical protein KGS61_09760 [Verrucomicrobia bacterium]|nr:hypothetical protein [Verrucomicrobiota bacterium]
MKPLTIVGGGLAGLTLGIGLRQRGVPVMIWEAGGYPRHRVCGEFISGCGPAALAALGLAETLVRAGAWTARTARFGSQQTLSPVRTLPEPALCLSRYVLDRCLADEFRRLGGMLREYQRWKGDEFGPGMVRATGRRLRSHLEGWRWFGLKAHLRNVALDADLEMHLVPGGYVGLCRLRDGVVNLCGLFQRRTPASISTTPGVAGARPGTMALSRSLPLERLRSRLGPELSLRLADAKFDEDSACAVAGLSFQRHRATTPTACCVGDAISMIPPATGNGMSMAFESAVCALDPLTAYTRGAMSWDEAQQAVARVCDQRFRRRLVWGRWLDWTLFQPGLREAVARWAPRSDWVWRTLFARTR